VTIFGEFLKQIHSHTLRMEALGQREEILMLQHLQLDLIGNGLLRSQTTPYNERQVLESPIVLQIMFQEMPKISKLVLMDQSI
jgi:hypothetical protein